MPDHPTEAVLYGLDLSYFTGKVQAYLRYAQIPHRFQDMCVGDMRKAAAQTGMAQMPAVHLPDGRWMTDSSAIIDWFDGEGATPVPVIPRQQPLRFLSLLVEDYADEWLWRPALHYRWSYTRDARLMGHRIADEMMRDVGGPLWLRRVFITHRQRAKYLRGDGVTRETAPHVESIYLRNLDWLEAILTKRDFLLGGRPTIADFGYFASMFRHFSIDPTPARIMRDRAPAVHLWVARMWAARAGQMTGKVLADTPTDWAPILADIGASYMPYLAANAQAFNDGRATFELALEGVRYTLPVNRYRVWRLQQMQADYDALPTYDAQSVRDMLEAAGVWEPMWRTAHPESGFDPDRRLPFLTPATAWATEARKRGRPMVHDGEAR